jgi:hypothetical protein
MSSTKKIENPSNQQIPIEEEIIFSPDSSEDILSYLSNLPTSDYLNLISTNCYPLLLLKHFYKVHYGNSIGIQFNAFKVKIEFVKFESNTDSWKFENFDEPLLEVHHDSDIIENYFSSNRQYKNTFRFDNIHPISHFTLRNTIFQSCSFYYLKNFSLYGSIVLDNQSRFIKNLIHQRNPKLNPYSTYSFGKDSGLFDFLKTLSARDFSLNFDFVRSGLNVLLDDENYSKDVSQTNFELKNK